VNDETIAKFAQGLRGTLIGRRHPEYEEARKLYNAMIDKRPLLIARCADAADVIAAVNFGRDNKLPIAIRSGRTQWTRARQRRRRSGHRPLDDEGGARRSGEADGAVGGGCVKGDVDHATHVFGLAVPFGIVSTTGVNCQPRSAWGPTTVPSSG
jgi:FAD/FMN-containing dehydrogenase